MIEPRLPRLTTDRLSVCHTHLCPLTNKAEQGTKSMNQQMNQRQRNHLTNMEHFTSSARQLHIYSVTRTMRCNPLKWRRLNTTKFNMNEPNNQ